jgi:mRNA interferase MazF
MPTYEIGSVILVNFPFTDLLSSKVRPALVLAPHGEDVIILGIFSKVPEGLQPSWVKIDQNEANFRQTGLKKTSIIKTEKITVLHKSLIKPSCPARGVTPRIMKIGLVEGNLKSYFRTKGRSASCP